MISIEEINKFLLKADRGHADGTAELKKQVNGSRTITFSDGDFSMEDNFFGGEPYGGQQVIFYKNEPVWICVYYGRVLETELPADDVYDFLREALQHPNLKQPLRGPATYKNNRLEYQNMLEGDTANYLGREIILENGKEIFWTQYVGGWVDQRFKGSV